MKAQLKQSIGFVLIIIILSGMAPLWAQDNAGDYVTINGVVRDKYNKKRLEYVNISIPGSNVGTVTNAEGEFSLKIKETDRNKMADVSHVG